MADSQQVSIWDDSTMVKIPNWHNEKNNGDEHRHKSQSSRSGYSNYCCCSCSRALLFGLAIGVLLAGGVLAVIVSLYVVDSKKTTSDGSIHGTLMTVSTTSITTVTTTTATTSTSTTTSSTSSTSTSTTTTAPYCHTMVSFDDIPGQSGSFGFVSNGYKSLDWVNVQYINGSSMPTSGFHYGVNSDPYVACSPNGMTVSVSSANGTHFSFDSVVVTSAWRDDLEWTLYGSRGGAVSLVGSIRLQVMNRTTITCTGCTNWDAFYFTSSGGIPRTGLVENGTEFVFDDLCISFGY